MMPTLRALRESRGWRQQDLAVALGVTRSTVAAWEDPARKSGFMPSRRSILALAQVFGVDPDDIAFGGDAKRGPGYPAGRPRKPPTEGADRP